MRCCWSTPAEEDDGAETPLPPGAVAAATTGDGVLAATVGMGQGRFEVADGVMVGVLLGWLDLELGSACTCEWGLVECWGRCWCCSAGEAAGVDAAWDCAGDAEAGAGVLVWLFTEDVIVGVCGTDGVASSPVPSVSRLLLTPLDVLSFSPNDVALMRI